MTTDLLRSAQAIIFNLDEEVRYLRKRLEEAGIAPDPWQLTPCEAALLRELCMAPEGVYVPGKALIPIANRKPGKSKHGGMPTLMARLRCKVIGAGIVIESSRDRKKPGYRIVTGLLDAQIGLGIRKPSTEG